MKDGDLPRAIPEIHEELAGIRNLLEGKDHVVDPAIRRRLGERRKRCRDELIEADNRLAEGR